MAYVWCQQWFAVPVLLGQRHSMGDVEPPPRAAAGIVSDVQDGSEPSSEIQAREPPSTSSMLDHSSNIVKNHFLTYRASRCWYMRTNL